jgi:hypothetical protein
LGWLEFEGYRCKNDMLSIKVYYSKQEIKR